MASASSPRRRRRRVTIDTVPPSAVDFARLPARAVRAPSTVHRGVQRADGPCVVERSGLDRPVGDRACSIAGTTRYDVAQPDGQLRSVRRASTRRVVHRDRRQRQGCRRQPRVSPGSWSITPLSPTTLSVAAAARVILRGGSTRIDVVLDRRAARKHRRAERTEWQRILSAGGDPRAKRSRLAGRGAGCQYHLPLSI